MSSDEKFLKNRPGWVVETMSSSVVGAVVQVVVTVILTTSTGLALKAALGIALPVAAISFAAFWYGSRILRRKIAETGTKSTANILTDDVADILQEMGITGGTAKLMASKFEPLECMNQSRKTLYFLGIGGSKWVTEPHIRAEFKHFLERVQAMRGSVRFLLLDPRGESFRQLHNLREGNLSAEPLHRFKEFVDAYPCLQVRLYDQFPCFRLVFIDDDILALSRYKSDREGYFKSRFGWEAPHLVVSASAPWSLYTPFSLYYEQLWSSSEPL